jgi:hypothetical protein
MGPSDDPYLKSRQEPASVNIVPNYHAYGGGAHWLRIFSH